MNHEPSGGRIVVTRSRPKSIPPNRLLRGVALLVSALIFAPGLQAQEDPLVKARSRAEERLAKAIEAQRQAEGLQDHADYSAALARDPEMETSHERARQLLATARSAFGEADQRASESGFRDAGVLASGARRGFEDYLARVRQQLRRIELERNPPPPPPPPPSEDAAEGAIETTGDPSDQSTNPGQTQEATQTTPSTSPRPKASQPPPADLRRGVELFFMGDYAGTIEALAALDVPGALSPKPRAHGHLLRAAARYALFILGGEQDFSLRGGATDDVLACRAADAELAPGDMFSPRFRDFFAATR